MMACDDNQGQHIAEICKQCGLKIPEEIALLGVDNDEVICTLSDPPLSSINQAVEKGGYEAAELMDRMIRNPQKQYGDVVVYPTHIITRQSTDIFATTDKYISAVLKFIHQNTDKKLNIDQITRLAPLSRRLLENRFKQEIGLPIYSYIMNLRIEKFAHKLIETDAPIVEITQELEFSDYKNIARLFKKIKGITPSEYRNKNSIR
jgi:LacI family transcriptional regulator